MGEPKERPILFLQRACRAFLDLDHVNNDGRADRAERGNGQRLYVWLKANGWPRDRYQLLCCNCNQGKARNGGVCPHATRRSA